MTHIATYIC